VVAEAKGGSGFSRLARQPKPTEGRRTITLSLEVAFGEGAAGAALEVSLEGEGLAVVCEPDGDDEFPRAVPGRVRRLPAVVLREALVGVVGDADVVEVGSAEALKDIDRFQRSASAKATADGLRLARGRRGKRRLGVLPGWLASRSRPKVGEGWSG